MEVMDSRGWYVCMGIGGAVEHIGATSAAIGFKVFSCERLRSGLDRRRLGSRYLD